MFEPRQWFRTVVWVGIMQAGLSAASTAWFAEASRIESSGLDQSGAWLLALFAFTSIFLPFIAYAGDSRTVLNRYPNDSSAVWQVMGGLIGLSLPLVVLHGFVLAKLIELDTAIGSALLLSYRLVFPAFVIGSLGAVTGIAVALVLHWLIVK